MTRIQEEAFEKVVALRKLTAETGCITSRTQNRVLQQLCDDDLAIVARELDIFERDIAFIKRSVPKEREKQTAVQQ